MNCIAKEVVFIVRQERLDDAKRARLMEAAIEEFSERGFEGASYNKIIERSGLSKGTVYYYFDNKDSLLRTVLDEICERFLDAIGDLRLPETPEEYWETDLEYHKRAMRFFLENPSLSRVMFWLSKDDFFSDERLFEAHKRASESMDKLIARGQEIGAVRSDLPVTTIQRLMHAVGKVLSSAILGECESCGTKDKVMVQAQVERFMLMVHDLGRRALTP